jgi:hypothetical protein
VARLRRDGLIGLPLLLLARLPLLWLLWSKLLLLLFACSGALLVPMMVPLDCVLLCCCCCDEPAPADCCGRSCAGQLAALARGLLLLLLLPASGVASCGDEICSGCRLLQLLSDV